MTSKITRSGSISSECWLVNMLLLGEINFFFPSQFMSSKNFIGNETSVAVSEKCPIQFNFVLNIEQLIAEISPQYLNYSIFICYLAFWLMDLISYFIPYIRIKMSCSLDVCQPNPSTFSVNCVVWLVVNYFSIPHNCVSFIVKKKTNITDLIKLSTILSFIKEIMKIVVLGKIYCLLFNFSSLKNIQW